MSSVSDAVSAVVVDFHAGSAVADCVASLRSNGVDEIVVVDNDSQDRTLDIARPQPRLRARCQSRGRRGVAENLSSGLEP